MFGEGEFLVVELPMRKARSGQGFFGRIINGEAFYDVDGGGRH